MIVKEGNKFLVKTEDGKRTLGRHSDKASAKRQLAAIEINKNKKKEPPTKRKAHPQKKLSKKQKTAAGGPTVGVV